MYCSLYVQKKYVFLNLCPRRFKKLDADGSGSLSWEELMDIPELGQNPLVQRVVGKMLKNVHTILILNVKCLQTCSTMTKVDK